MATRLWEPSCSIARVRRWRKELPMKARLLEWREIAPQTRNFVFEVPESERIAFVPGQFLSFTAEINGKEITRAYSVASPPDGNRFELCLNLVEDGLFSPLLF